MSLTVSLSLLAACLSLLFLAVLFLRQAELHAQAATARRYRLHFPRGLTPEAVTAFVAGLSGLRPVWYRRWYQTPYVAFEIIADPAGIRHYLVTATPLVGVVAAHMRAALPAVRLAHEPETEPPPLRLATELALSTQHRPLRTDQLEGASKALLASLQPVKAGEAVWLQWLLTPAAVPRPPRLAKATGQPSPIDSVLPDTDSYEKLPHGEAVKAERDKQVEPLFQAVGRVGVTSPHPARAEHLLRRSLGSLQVMSAPGIELRPRYGVPQGVVAARVRRRQAPLLAWPALLNAAEAVGVLGWPLGAVQLPGLTLGGARQLAPSADLPRSGCVIGRATFPGTRRPLAITPADRLLHLHVLGPTGAGKSTLLLNLITQDMQAGRGAIVIDPKGDLVADCLARVPADRVNDVVVLDPSDEARPVGLNLLGAGAGNPELAAEHVVFIFAQLFKAYWGPRTDDCLRAALLTLLHDPGMTLVEVPLLLSNATFRRPFVARVSDDLVGLGGFWDYYEHLSANDRSQVIAPLMNKLRATLLRTRVRNTIGQANARLDMETVLARGQLLFVPLRKGTLGEEAAALVGSLVVSRLWQATQARAALRPDQRPLVMAYIDEVQDYLHLPSSVGDMLAQARGLGLGLTLAHQHLGQLTPELRRDLLTNCRSKVFFQTTADDARALERELRPFVTSEDLQELGRFEAVARLSVGQRVAPPVSTVTLPAPPETGQGARALAASRRTYGRERSAVEAAMQTRHASAVASPGPVGRRKRSGTTGASS